MGVKEQYRAGLCRQRATRLYHDFDRFAAFRHIGLWCRTCSIYGRSEFDSAAGVSRVLGSFYQLQAVEFSVSPAVSRQATHLTSEYRREAVLETGGTVHSPVLVGRLLLWQGARGRSQPSSTFAASAAASRKRTQTAPSVRAGERRHGAIETMPSRRIRGAGTLFRANTSAPQECRPPGESGFVIPAYAALPAIG
jgi:hypothetical protein